jgi:chitinase
MAPASLLVLLAALLYATTFFAAPAMATGKTGQVAVFWGRNKYEGSLREVCDSRKYTIAIISFLDVFGHGNHHLDLSGHDVSSVGGDIKYCQSKRILVFLSIGGFGNQYFMPSPKAAEAVADYLWNAYMRGKRWGVERPFGDASVDGIDFFIDGKGAAAENYDELARKLRSYNNGYRGRTPVQLTATVRCGYPDRRMERALATGLFTRIFVRFYDNATCALNWPTEWKKWTAAYPSASIYIGLPASKSKVGYMRPTDLHYEFLPMAQKAANYGGVMVWDRYDDKQTGYSNDIIQWA